MPQQILILNTANEKHNLILWDLYVLVMSPWKNGHMLGFVRSARLNITRPNGCSSPCLTRGIAPLHLGVLPSNWGLGMPYPRYVPCPVSAHSQLHLTPLTLSCPLLSCSIECFRHFEYDWHIQLFTPVSSVCPLLDSDPKSQLPQTLIPNHNFLISCSFFLL